MRTKKEIKQIIGKENATNLQQEFNELLDRNASYFEFDQLLADYGLEPDYIECLIY